MRKRVMLIAAPLCMVVVAASVAVAAPGAGHPRGERLDELHAERPTAAFGRTAEPSIAVIRLSETAKSIQDYVVYLQSAEYLHQVVVGAYIASLEAAETQTAARRSSPVYSSSEPGGFLSCIRQRESGGNYSVYNSGGSGAAGAYQFMPGTWNSTAASVGRADLVGVDPAQAAPADQDAMAQALYAQQGAAPWGGGC